MNKPEPILRLFAKYNLNGFLLWNESLDFFVNCNDLFLWGTADAQKVTSADVVLIEATIKECWAIDPDCYEFDGLYLWVARQRKMRPQQCEYPDSEKLWPLFDACGPERPHDGSGKVSVVARS